MYGGVDAVNSEGGRDGDFDTFLLVCREKGSSVAADIDGGGFYLDAESVVFE